MCICVCVLSCFSHVQLFVTLWTIACQAPLSMEFSRQEYWSGWPCPPPGDLPGPGIKPKSLMSPALEGEFFITRAIWEACVRVCVYVCKHVCVSGCVLSVCVCTGIVLANLSWVLTMC